MMKLVALAAGAAAACVDDASWTFDLNGVDGKPLTCSKLARKLAKGVPAAKARRLAAIGRSACPAATGACPGPARGLAARPGDSQCYDADRAEIPAAVCACHASCRGCGYTADRMPTRASDCVACPEGSFLFPQRDDMTGLCVGDYAPTPLPSYAPTARRGYLDGEPGTCAETWTVPSLPGCEAPQRGCPAKACDGEDRRWCCPPGAADCATEWRHCGDDAPSAAPTYGPSPRPTRAPVDGAYRPTANPSYAPSAAPSAPTYAPSAKPTRAPVDGAYRPTANPSYAPTASVYEPSAAPSKAPSYKPTHRPWYKPTDRPA